MLQQDSKRYIVGVDLGGTNVRAAVVDPDGKALGDAREQSLAMSGQDVTIGQIIKSIRGALSVAGIPASQVAGIGMGVPGTIKPKLGMVTWAPNFKGWDSVQIVAPIRDDLGAPVFIGNDANVAALGEFAFGAGRASNSLVMFTLGTGIGSGVILDGKLWIGASEGAAEMGHIILMPDGPRCACGRYGCLEAFAGQAAIINRAQRKLYQGRDSLLIETTANDISAITPALIAEAAYKGDCVAIETMDETGYYIGLGIANAINTLSPEMVVIGGGVSQAGDVLMKPLMRTVRVNALSELLDYCTVTLAQLGDDAGVMGGVALAMQELRG